MFPALEGTRPVLVEIQALIVRLASGATPRRAAVGWDCGRLAMVLAVLEARCGLSFATAEVYLNVAGGYRLTDPAADLAVAAALVSALTERPVPARRGGHGRSRAVGRGAAGRRMARCGSRKRPSSGSSAAGSRPASRRRAAMATTRFAKLGELVDLIARARLSSADCALAMRASRRFASRRAMTALDIFVILLLGGAALIGFVRGFAHEVLALLAWIVGDRRAEAVPRAARRSGWSTASGPRRGRRCWPSPCCSCRPISRSNCSPRRSAGGRGARCSGRSTACSAAGSACSRD